MCCVFRARRRKFWNLAWAVTAGTMGPQVRWTAIHTEAMGHGSLVGTLAVY